MGIFTFTARVHSLIYQKSNIEYRLLKLTKKLRNLQQYAAAISSGSGGFNGSITIGDLLNSPGSMMGRTMNYMAYAHNSALQYVQQNAPYMQQMYMQQIGQQQSAQQQQMMAQYINRQLYMQGRERAMQVETKNLKIIEERLTNEKEQLETLGKEVDEDLKAAKESRDNAIKDMAPKYTFA